MTMDAKSQEIFNKHFDYCKVYTRPCSCPYKHCRKIVSVVDAIWRDVDRPNVGGWVHHNATIVQRMAEAIYAGVVFNKVQLRTDVNKRTYISAWCNIYWKHANADLMRLGF